MKVELTKSRGEMNFDSNTGIDFFSKTPRGITEMNIVNIQIGERVTVEPMTV